MKTRACFVLFVILSLGGPGSARTSSDCTCDKNPEPSVVPKIADYNIRIKEEGTVFTEKVEIDEKKQTETFKVPAHNGADEIQILNDFKMKLTMLRSHVHKTCFLMSLNKEVPTPRKLKEYMDKASKIPTKREVRVKKTSVSVGKEVTDRTVLSDELASFCAKYPIFHLNTIQDPTMVNITKTAEKSAEPLMRVRRSHRSRRQISLCPNTQIVLYPALERCAGEMCQTQANKVCASRFQTPALVCKKIGYSCNYLVRCEMQCPNTKLLCPDNCPGAISNSGGTGTCRNSCFTYHFIVDKHCCYWVCQ